MDTQLHHDLDVAKDRAHRASERFVSSLRAYVLINMAGELRADYEHAALPEHLAAGGAQPAAGPDVHDLLRGRPPFNLYGSLRCTAQELVWSSVVDSINADAESLTERCEALAGANADAAGTLELDPDLAVPHYVAAMDVHLMPGNYDGRDAADSVLPGAVYDNGLNVFAFGAMGKELNDIGWSMANYLRITRPEFAPEKILDVGCTIGHNTLPWKQTFPDAEVHGVDVAGACLRYAHARAKALGVPVHFHQQSAERLRFADESVDVVFSSMFLHELPEKAIRAFLAEAHRVLRPGGIMLHMELPPNSALTPYDAFYLDWDGYYNNEPFYKGFRDQDYRELCTTAGFAPEQFFESVMPRYTYVTEEAFRSAVTGSARFDEDTGRLSDAIQWYAFGSRK